MLPIVEIRPQLRQALLEGNRQVIGAPTGSGKSTQVPKYLLDAKLNGKILVLEPRRLAARMLARRVSSELNEPVGLTVGYQTRFESEHTKETQILYMTEGILPRMLQSNPRLNGVGAVVLDEFHERSLDADLALGAIMQLQADRPDLQLLVMSATLETAALAEFLNPCQVLQAEGRLHPIEIEHAQPGGARESWDQAALAVKRLVATGDSGDVLVFMPGAYEIRRTIEAVRKTKLGERVSLFPLYGDLGASQQDEALGGCELRKVIVATNIAETSLTIPGVRHVVDAGLARVNRYDPARGLNSLNLEPISRASAIQRTGRAGREGPGRCLRLYTRREFDNRPAMADPEIHRVDLSELLLYLASRSLDAAEFPWLSPPQAHALAEASRLLVQLEAVEDEELTVTGRALAKLPMHPRLARLLYEARDRECLQTAIEVAALLSERSIVTGGAQGMKTFFRNSQNAYGKGPESDLVCLLKALHLARERGFDRHACDQQSVHANTCRQVWRSAAQFAKVCERLKWRITDFAPFDELIKCLVTAFPDRLAARQDLSGSICRLAEEGRADLSKAASVRKAPLIVAAEYRVTSKPGAPTRAELGVVSEVREEWLRELDPGAFSVVDRMEWVRTQQLIEARRVTRWRGLVLSTAPGRRFNYEQAAAMLAERIISEELQLRGWNKDCKAWQERVRWLTEVRPEQGLPAYDDDDMRIVYAEFADGARRYTDIRDKPVLPYLKNVLSWDDQQFVEKMAPAELPLPGGRKLRISYRPGRGPTGRAKIQELYGLEETPQVAGGTPVQIEILGPNMRPVQVTEDLAGFWRDLYPEIKPALARRYPKHEWR
jgi:ATP-dependent helicase HrpB